MKTLFKTHEHKSFCCSKQDVSYKDGRQSSHEYPTRVVPQAEVQVSVLFTESVFSLGWQEPEVKILVFVFNSVKV